MKTARFEAVVQEAGAPVSVTLWTKPEEDRDFMRAVKEGRVVTVIQQNVGTKKDFGLVGFHPHEMATYLVFPKAMSQPDQTKIVGIKYEQLAAADPKGEIYRPPAAKPVPRRPKMQKRSRSEAGDPATPKPAPKSVKPTMPKAPKLFRWEAQVTLNATQNLVIDVEAPSASEAARLLKDLSAGVTLDPAVAKVSKRVGKPTKRS